MLRNIPNNTLCFVDANIFYYSLVSTPDLSADCIEFIKRIEYGEITASTSSTVLAEAIHKVMIAEAVQQYGLSRQGLAHRLQRQAHLIPQLSEHKKVTALIRALNLHVESVTLNLLERAADCSTQHQLLTNDASTIAVMEKLRLADLVTNDDNFDSVAGLTVWKPR
jgi:predicted nucleic acid-binding protein